MAKEAKRRVPKAFAIRPSTPLHTDVPRRVMLDATINDAGTSCLKRAAQVQVL